MEPVLFENNPIAAEDLPKVEDLPEQPLNPVYLKIEYAGTAILMAFLMIPLIILPFTDAPGIIAPIGAAVWLFLLILQLVVIRRGFHKKSFSIREKDITYRSGLIWQEVTTIPFQRIQHCEVIRGPLDQLFGLASLKVYTAGGGSTDLEIPGLDPEKATQMKDFILNQMVNEGDE
ncbi:MAG: PH domain-containing protein [Bacteroidia bacterium]|nr:PH domain-containing protein [Bacteroidia bacterium]